MVDQTPRAVARGDYKVALDNRKKSPERRLEVIRSRTPLLIRGMESDMAAIDHTIGQHLIMVDVDAIPAISTQDYAWYLQPGQMSRLILKALREVSGPVLGRRPGHIYDAKP